MKKILPALAVAVIAGIGATSAAQAATHIINFSATSVGTGITYSGSTLEGSTAYNLDGATWTIQQVLTGDESGLTSGQTNAFTIAPPTLTYGMMDSLTGLDITKTWTASIGPSAGDVFVETLNSVSISRGAAHSNAATFTFSGTLTDTTDMSIWDMAPAEMVLAFTQAGGNHNIVSVTLTDSASISSGIPESSTWVMMALGFVGLGYAAVRRSSKDRSAVAMI
jgi:hypothetical protein